MKTHLFSKVALCTGVAAAALSMATLVPSHALASTLTVDRGLPTDNLNNAAGSNRSNVAWADGSANTWEGDTFSLSSERVVDDLRVWVITNGTNFGDTYSDLSLYLGSSSGSSVNKVASSTFSTGSSASSNANVTVTPVTYAGGASYQASGGSYRQIWQLDFANLGTYAAGDYMFGLSGATNYYTFMHASNAALGGVPADGADNTLWTLTGADGAASLAIAGSWDSNGNGWDKSSDLNVQVFTSATPIPASLPLFLTGIGLLGFVVYRRKKGANVAGMAAA